MRTPLPLIGIGPGTFEFLVGSGRNDPRVRPRRPLALPRDAWRSSGSSDCCCWGVCRHPVDDRRASCARFGRPDRRALLAAATAACFAFAAAAPSTGCGSWRCSCRSGSRSWPPQFGAGPELGPPEAHPRRSLRRAAPRVVALCRLAMVAIAIPLAGTSSVRASQDRANGGRARSGARRRKAAHEIQPYAATPEPPEGARARARGDVDGRAAAATVATETSRPTGVPGSSSPALEAERGYVGRSIAAYRRPAR